MNPEPKTFRLQNRRLHLTYKSHIDPGVWLSWAKKLKKLPIELYSIVHETGSDSYKHTHILIDVGPKNKISTTNIRFFDWTNSFTNETIHPNINPIASLKHWNNSVIYHYKENVPFTNIEKPEDCKSEIESIWKCDTVSDALLTTCKTLKEIGGVIAAFNCKPSDYGLEPEIKWKPWQSQLYNELTQTPDERKVIWNYDPHGGNGKTFFAKHMGMYKGAFVSTKADTYHVATSIDEFIRKNGNSVLIVIFNFTRQQQLHNVYQALEELKDGLVTSQKYKGRTMFFKSPHVVVFANYLPEIKHLTIDRWDIRVIQDEKIVKKYVSGKTVFTDPSIDPYTAYSLQHIENQFKDLGFSTEELVPPGPPGPPSHLNIKVAPPLAPLAPAAKPQVPPSAPQLAPLAPAAKPQVPPSAPQLAPLAPAAKPQVPPSAPQTIKGNFKGNFKGNTFITSNPPPDTPDWIEQLIDDKKYLGKWLRGIFYIHPSSQ